jgi:hypothetical protein
MVLPEGIELSTSPLPRECSTTELRQRRVGGRGIASDVRRVQGVGLAPCGALGSCWRMDKTPPSRSARPRDASAARQARLEREAAALRENLRKRKEQARARQEADATPTLPKATKQD